MLEYIIDCGYSVISLKWACSPPSPFQIGMICCNCVQVEFLLCLVLDEMASNLCWKSTLSKEDNNPIPLSFRLIHRNT